MTAMLDLWRQEPCARCGKLVITAVYYSGGQTFSLDPQPLRGKRRQRGILFLGERWNPHLCRVPIDLPSRPE